MVLKKLPAPPTVDEEGMIAAIVRTHRIREAMSERFHWFGWKEKEDLFLLWLFIVVKKL